MRGSESSRKRRWIWWIGGLVALGVVVVMAIAGSAKQPSAAPGSGGDAIGGEALFVSNCSACHGVGANGTDSGPPLLHELYLPDHHADIAFTLAVRNGVRPHHWNFGAMPPIGDVSDQDVKDIVAYVRALQGEAGLLGDS
jgi:mono/diheme cytochrome c family protein